MIQNSLMSTLIVASIAVSPMILTILVFFLGGLIAGEGDKGSDE